MKTLHLYPFDISVIHGGSMRLKTACEATPDSTVLAFDGATGEWRFLEPTAIGSGGGTHAGSARWSVKRRLFPSTLWESGRDACAAFVPHLAAAADFDVVIAHTTYLAPLARRLRDAGAPRVVIDVYDLVWRAHSLDGRLGGAASVPRLAYSRVTRAREERALRSASSVLFAGWADAAACEQVDAWAPTGVARVESGLPSVDGPLRLGLLGNFAHWPTAEGARRLLSSPAACSRGVEIVFAGYGSEGCAAPTATRLGIVGDLADFYRQVDCIVVPVSTGAGLKVKIAEGVLARRPVITSPIGSEGYPPSLRRHLTIVEPNELTVEVVRWALANTDVACAAEEFEAVVGQAAASARYADLLERAACGSQ